jgi:hypothetical protein
MTLMQVNFGTAIYILEYDRSLTLSVFSFFRWLNRQSVKPCHVLAPGLDRLSPNDDNDTRHTIHQLPSTLMLVVKLDCH